MKRLTVFLAVLALSGCAMLSSINSGTAAAVQGGIELVTALYIQHKGNNNAATEAQVAQQLTTIATELKGVVSGDLTIAQFNSGVSAYIAKLTPVEQIIAVELLSQLDAYFAAQLGTGSILTATTKAAATAVLNDVIAASAFYLSAPSAIKQA